MTAKGAPFTSGNWVVSEGKEDEFVAAWSELVKWTFANVPGARSVTLIRQNDDPRHFISFGEWESADRIAAWRSHPEFPQKLGPVRSLCDEFTGLDYTVAAHFTPS